MYKLENNDLTIDHLRLIMEGTSNKIGREFFDSLVHCLAGAINVKFAVISKITGKNMDSALTLSMWGNNDYLPNLEYSLKGTPCENVVDQSICLINDIQKIFPDDEFLKIYGLYSYLGVPIRDHLNKTIGLLTIMHDKPIENEDQSKIILSIFASRAAVELDRQSAEHKLLKNEGRLKEYASILEKEIANRKSKEIALKASEEHLRSILSNTSAVVYLKDLKGRYILINNQYEKIFNLLNSAVQGKNRSGYFPKKDC